MLCVGHLTFVLREYQDNLLVGHCTVLWGRGEMPEKWFRLGNKFQPCRDNLHFWVELFWSQSMKLLISCVSAQEKQFTISSQIRHGWHWTLAQIQETKPNRSTPRQMRNNSTQGSALWQVRLLRIIPAIDTPQLFNVEHEFHFDVFLSHSTPPSNTLWRSWFSFLYDRHCSYLLRERENNKLWVWDTKKSSWCSVFTESKMFI